MIEQQHGNLCYLQFNHFLQFPEITHGVFTRLGGYSQPPYQGLNISFSSGDSLDNVVRNRLLTLQALQLQAYPCATLWQVHGADIVTLDAATWDDWHLDWPHRSYNVNVGTPLAGALLPLQWTCKPQRKADAIITKQRGVALTLASADCVTLLFYDPVQGALGMAHAGWRGTARGIAAATVDALSEQFACLPRDIYVGIGPSIGPCCYEISEDVQRLFLGQTQFEELPTAEKYRNLVRASAVFTIDTGLHLDLWQTNRNQLLMSGLSPEHIELPDACTCCHMNRFFSHRGEHGKTGRFPAILALRNLSK